MILLVYSGFVMQLMKKTKKIKCFQSSFHHSLIDTRVFGNGKVGIPDCLEYSIHGISFIHRFKIIKLNIEQSIAIFW